ncbi:MAG: Tad domain-containing protein [Nitrospirota bacterium]|nr:Tad domain-containing protein [Nitrospirota bacterium]
MMNRRQKLYSYAIEKVHEQHGVVSLIMAVSTTMLLGFTALAIDLGHAWMVKQELQNVADAAALAGAGQLGQVYQGMSAEDQGNYFLTSADKQVVVNQINSLSPNSHAGGTSLAFRTEDLEVGVWDSTTKTFTPVPPDDPASPRPTAVRVQVRRDETANTPLATFLGGLVGVEGISITASATAAMTSITTASPGVLGAPIAVSQEWLEAGNCGGNIKFYPTGDIEGCAGWHTYTDPDSSAANLKGIIQGLTGGSYTSPETKAGQTIFEFNGGALASIFNSFEALYNANKDAAGNWSVLVPVYSATDCSNPSGPILIVGFLTVTITSVQGAPSKIIEAVVNCNTFEAGRGDGQSGGPATTPLGIIPSLVA